MPDIMPEVATNKILVLREGGALQDIIGILSKVPRVSTTFFNSINDAKNAGAKYNFAAALVDGSIGGALGFCGYLKKKSPTTRIYYFPRIRGDVEGKPGYLDEIYPQDTYVPNDVVGGIDELLENLERPIRKSAPH